MNLEDLALLSKRDRMRAAIVILAMFAEVIWLAAVLMKPAPPRRVPTASGSEF